jgi:hypothetical protein
LEKLKNTRIIAPTIVSAPKPERPQSELAAAPPKEKELLFLKETVRIFKCEEEWG